MLLFILLPSQAGKKLFPFTSSAATVVVPSTHNESRRPLYIQTVSPETALGKQGMDLANLHSGVGNQISGMPGWEEGGAADGCFCVPGGGGNL